MEMTSILKYEPDEAQSPPVTVDVDGYSYGYGHGNGNGSDVADVDETEATVAERFSHEIDALISKADELEERVKEVAEFYEKNKKQTSNNSKGSSLGIKCRSNVVKKQIDVGRKEASCSKRMQEVMRQFGTILKQLSQHKWAWPFMQPVDVKGLGLDDYHKIIKKPMDFTTIRSQMDANIYKNAREIYADVRLVFSNAMTYNDEESDVHEMAKTLMGKFEEKWHQLLPKVIEAETREKGEETCTLENMQIVQEAMISKIARDTEMELNELNMHLDELRELLVLRCRKISTEEKRKLSIGLSALPTEDLNRAMDIVVQADPNFLATGEELEFDMDAQSEITLWRLKFFVKEALEIQAKNAASKANEIAKHEQVIYDALAKTAKKRKNLP